MKIGICGYKGHGKDSLARLVVERCPEFEIVHFADELKRLSQCIFGLSDYQLNDHVGKEEKFPSPVGLDWFLEEMRRDTGLNIQPAGAIAHTPRQILQYFGSEYVRAVSPSFWIDRLLATIQDKPKILCCDVRFSNEADALRSVGGRIIRVHREDLMASGDIHQSERCVADIVPDLELRTKTGEYGPQIFLADLLAGA